MADNGQFAAEEKTQKLVERIAKGFIVETMDDMDEGYLKALKQTLTITGDTELLSVPPLLTVYKNAPTLNRKITALAVIQDEIAHAHVAYTLLEDLGVDTTDLLYFRSPEKWKNPYAFDYKLNNFVELGVFNAFYDRAGYTLLEDVGEHTSFGPWKRALVKVGKEELFHLRNGESIMKEAMKNPETRVQVEAAVNWMFLMALEFFGVADELKSRTAQLDYKLKGKSNDELRQVWLSKCVPFCESIGVKIPAHYDEEAGKYVIDVAFPAKLDKEQRKWLVDQPDTWDNVIKRFKERGPENQEFVERVRKGYHDYQKMREVS